MVWNTKPTPSQVSASIGIANIRHVFLFNPDEVKWSYSNNTISRDTIGGRVVQLLSSRVEQMTVVGRAGSREELQKLALNLKKIMNHQIKTQTPIRFKVPSRKWNFKVYLQNVSSLGWDYAATSYPYELTLLVQEDLTGLTSKVIMRDSLTRLAQGIGYSEQYHGGNGDHALAISESYLRGMNFIKSGGSITASVPGGVVSGDGSGGDGPAGTANQFQGRTDIWQPGIANLPWKGTTLREAVTGMLNAFVTRSTGHSNFVARDIDIAYCVIKHESGWNPNAINTANKNGSIDRGLWQINTIHDEAKWYPINNVNLLFNAEYNTRCALDIWIKSGWTAWSTYNNTETGCQPA